MVPDHEIFQGPFPVDIQYESVATPDNYRKYFDATDLPDEMSVWHVEEVDYTTVEGLNPGTVSTGWGFEDSPDAEAIAGGINSKAPSAVALGRHGSLFLWGFACEPGRMTHSGRNAFLNSVVYIQKFDHQQRLVRATASDRRWALQRAMGDQEKFDQVLADLEYLVAEGREHVIDEDCKALGLSNRDPQLLEHCISQLEAGEDVERCELLLRRYTGLDHPYPSGWRRWFDESKDRLFFSDRGGFRFYVEPEADQAAPEPSPAEAIEPPDEGAEVYFDLEPAAVPAGGEATVRIRFAHAEGWHTYVHVPSDSAYIATVVTFDLPEGVELAGALKRPPSLPHGDDPRVRVAEGLATFEQKVRVSESASAEAFRIGVTVRFMACDEMRCLPPDEWTETVTLEFER